jgi:hypothetical protein
LNYEILGKVLAPIAPLLAWIIDRLPLSDPWETIDLIVPHQRVATGSRHNFAWYFEGRSEVEVRSLEDIVAWLGTCAYESDMAVFNEEDFWQHPVTFEKLKRGDCEDFALWSWRKLLELGIDARLYVGRYAGSPNGGHAWVIFKKDGKFFLFDPVIRDDRIIRPLEECRDNFEPWFIISKTHAKALAGFLHRGREERMLKRALKKGLPQQRTTNA